MARSEIAAVHDDSISVGLAELGPTGTLYDLIERADAAMSSDRRTRRAD